MRLGIDVREACGRRTGKGQWTYGFVSELLTRGVSLTLFTGSDPLPPDWEAHIGERVRHVGIAAGGIAWHLKVAHAMTSGVADAYLSPVSYLVPCIIGKKMPVYTVVHDLIAFRDEPHDRKAVFIEKMSLGKALHDSTRILTVSDATCADLLERFPSTDPGSVTTVYAGGSWTDAMQRRPEPALVVCIGTLSPRKNQLRLIEAFDHLSSPLRETARLVLVGGRGWDDEGIVEKAQATVGVEWRDYLPDDECRSLLERATVFALPSLYEGFGLAILDCMAHGIPVLTSARGSLAEVGGDAVLAVNPEDTAAITGGLEKLLTDAALREQLVQKGLKQAQQFSWKRSVDLFLAAAGIDATLSLA